MECTHVELSLSHTHTHTRTLSVSLFCASEREEKRLDYTPTYTCMPKSGGDEGERESVCACVRVVPALGQLEEEE